MTVLDWTSVISLILLTILPVALYIVGLRKGFTRKLIALIVLCLGGLFLAYLAHNLYKIEPADWVQIMLMFALVAVTVLSTFSAFKQSNASVKMAEEMEEERLMVSRPVIIQKAVGKGLDTEPDVLRSDYFSHFEIYNAGNGPAIELTIAVVTEEKDSYIEARRETFMRAGDTPIEFHPFNISAVLEEKKTYYFACEYQGILSRVGKETWYQTWLPFKVDKASKEGEVYVTAGKLDFKEVTEKDRIDNLIRWSKPS